ncbi:MAG: cell envelope integrity protein TolA [Desulfurivibrionaceae bacterium]
MPFRPPTSELPDKQWQKSLGLTIAVHVGFILFGLFAPNLLHFQRKIPEVYTVNLFSVEDLGGPAPAAPKAAAAPQAEEAPQPKAAPAPEPTKPTPPQKPQPVPEPPAVAKDAISLKPIKTKEKADIDKVKMLRDKLLAENTEKQAKDAAEKARAEADKKAKGAVDSLKKALMAGQQLAAGKAAAGTASGSNQAGSGIGSGTGSGSGSSGGIAVDENLRRYLIAVNSQIQEHWVLPDLQNWKENVEAIVIIRVRRDGVVIESSFKKKSDNVFFNQFVEKTLKLSAPLPPFPVGINQSEMEIGLKFRPGEVF